MNRKNRNPLLIPAPHTTAVKSFPSSSASFTSGMQFIARLLMRVKRRELGKKVKQEEKQKCAGKSRLLIVHENSVRGMAAGNAEKMPQDEWNVPTDWRKGS